MAKYLSSSGFTHCHSEDQVRKSSVAQSRYLFTVVRASAGTSSSYQPDVSSSTAVKCRRVLGVGPNASRCEVKAAFRKLALECHPDVCRDDECHVNFTEVNRAYESLMALIPVKSQNCEASQAAPSAHEGDNGSLADFLESLISSYRREDFSSYYSNLKHYYKAGRSRFRSNSTASSPYY